MSHFSYLSLDSLLRLRHPTFPYLVVVCVDGATAQVQKISIIIPSGELKEYFGNSLKNVAGNLMTSDFFCYRIRDIREFL